MSKPRVLAFAGSLRAGSFNKRLISVATAHARQAGAEVTQIDLRDFPMPLFDEDLEKSGGLPPGAQSLKDAMLAHMGLLIACPEYNSSIAAVLKNAIDWASRPATSPDGKPEPPLACFDGRVVGLLSASPGALGGLRGLVTVRSILSNLKCIVLPDQVAVPKAHEAFDGEGKLKDAKVDQSVRSLAQRVVHTVDRLYP